MINVLFIHNNFPGQFRNIAAELARLRGVAVRAIGSTTAKALPGVQLLRYKLPRGSHANVHPFARRFDRDCAFAEQVLYAAQELRQTGFIPDIIFVHPGWGEAMPLRLLFPASRLVVYAEFYYKAVGADVGFDDAYGYYGIDGLIRTELRNAAQLMALEACDEAIAPTTWQKNLFPQAYHHKITVIHDGLDTEALQPATQPELLLPDGVTLSKNHKVLSYVSRSLEPMRGFHRFTELLPDLMRRHPDLQVVIVGDDRSSYGNPPKNGMTWREKCLDGIKNCVDLGKLHLVPRLDHDRLISLFQITRVHFYFTYPFVLSWSALEAMGCGAIVVGSRTGPVEEVIEDGMTGFLVPFHNTESAVNKISSILANPNDFFDIGIAARQSVIDRFDFEKRSKPAYFGLLKRLCDDWPALPNHLEGPLG